MGSKWTISCVVWLFCRCCLCLQTLHLSVLPTAAWSSVGMSDCIPNSRELPLLKDPSRRYKIVSTTSRSSCQPEASLKTWSSAGNHWYRYTARVPSHEEVQQLQYAARKFARREVIEYVMRFLRLLITLRCPAAVRLERIDGDEVRKK